MEDVKEYEKRVEGRLDDLKRDNASIRRELRSLKESRTSKVGKAVGVVLSKAMPRGFRHPDSMIQRREIYLPGRGKSNKMRPY